MQRQLGQSAAEYEPGGKAAEEIEAVYKAIRRLIDMSTRRGKTPREKNMSKRPNLADITAAAGSTRRQPMAAAPTATLAGPRRGGEERPVGQA